MEDRVLKFLKGFLQKTIAIVAFLLLWEIASKLRLINPSYLPPFSSVFKTFIALIKSGKLFIQINASLNRILIGLMLAVVIAIIFGFFIGFNERLSKVLKPILEFFRNTPTPALIPVLLMFFGIGEVTKIAIIFIEAFWPTFFATIEGVKYVDPLLIKAAKSMKVTKFELFVKVIIPSAIPHIITGFRLSATNAILILVAAEMLGGFKGLGLMISTSGGAKMYAAIATVTIIGVIMNFLIVNLENYITRWKEEIR